MKKFKQKSKSLLLLSGVAVMLLALFTIRISAANDPVLNDTNVVVDVGGTHAVSCTLNGATAVLSSLNTTVATVSSSGTVTGVSYGKTSITVQFFQKRYLRFNPVMYRSGRGGEIRFLQIRR